MAVYTLNSRDVQGSSSCGDGEERVRKDDWHDSGQAITNKSHNQVVESGRGCDVTRE
jgi:hypothetical protein